MTHSGEIAALITSFLWSASSIFFTKAGHVVGSVTVNRIRLIAAFFYLSIAHLLLDLPVISETDVYRWFWLGLSGAIGLALGDALLFQAYLMIGPRLSMLLLGLAPIFTAIAGNLFLNEKLLNIEIFGILLTISGVFWVLLENNSILKNNKAEQKIYALGVLLGIGSAFAQSFGYITSKLGLYGDFSPITGTWIRILIATIIIWLLTIITGQFKRTVDRLKINPRSFQYILIGAFIGPFLGITFSMVAIQNANVAIASTLMSLSPIFLLPISWIFFHERFNWRVIVGTCVAITGVIILFFV